MSMMNSIIEAARMAARYKLWSDTEEEKGNESRAAYHMGQYVSCIDTMDLFTGGNWTCEYNNKYSCGKHFVLSDANNLYKDIYIDL